MRRLTGVVVAAFLAGCAGPVAPSARVLTSAAPTTTASAPVATDTPTPVTPIPSPSPTEAVYVLSGTCDELRTADACQALAFAAARQLDVRFQDVVSLDILPGPSPTPYGGFGWATTDTYLSVLLSDGSSKPTVVRCVFQGFPGCGQPVVVIGVPGGMDTGGGSYTDVPVNARYPFPSLNPTAVANAMPLVIPSVTIPIRALGRQRVVLGRATLANGAIRESRAQMADSWPSTVLFGDLPPDYGANAVELVVRTLDGKRIDNLYAHGWHKGDEAVIVTIEFDVAWFEPGASFAVTDVLVR